MGLPLQMVKRTTTNSEFLKWLKFIRQEVNLFHREDWYHAKTIATIKQVHGIKSNPKEELIEFQWEGDGKKRKRTSTYDSKVMWASALGDFGKEIIEQIEAEHKGK